MFLAQKFDCNTYLNFLICSDLANAAHAIIELHVVFFCGLLSLLWLVRRRCATICATVLFCYYSWPFIYCPRNIYWIIKDIISKHRAVFALDETPTNYIVNIVTQNAYSRRSITVMFTGTVQDDEKSYTIAEGLE